MSSRKQKINASLFVFLCKAFIFRLPGTLLFTALLLLNWGLPCVPFREFEYNF
jgi:hypothetical protein